MHMKKNIFRYPALLLLVLGLSGFTGASLYSLNQNESTMLSFFAKKNTNPAAVETIYQFKVKDLAGQEVSLADYEGKVLLIVNTASKCGLTPQLKGLEALYQKYKDRGLVVLGFPSNDFGGQEPLEGAQISEFCTKNYGVSFPVFDKVSVKGDATCPLYQFLSDEARNGKVSAKPMWNFHKYLVGRDGKVVDYFASTTAPDAEKVAKAIEAIL